MRSIVGEALVLIGCCAMDLIQGLVKYQINHYIEQQKIENNTCNTENWLRQEKVQKWNNLSWAFKALFRCAQEQKWMYKGYVIFMTSVPQHTPTWLCVRYAYRLHSALHNSGSLRHKCQLHFRGSLKITNHPLFFKAYALQRTIQYNTRQNIIPNKPYTFRGLHFKTDFTFLKV